MQHNIIQNNTTPRQQHNITQHVHHTQHNTTQHNTTQHNTTQHNTTQHNTTQHNTTQHNNTTQQHCTTTQHNTTQHNTTQHNTITQQRPFDVIIHSFINFHFRRTKMDSFKESRYFLLQQLFF